MNRLQLQGSGRKKKNTMKIVLIFNIRYLLIDIRYLPFPGYFFDRTGRSRPTPVLTPRMKLQKI